MTTTSSCGLYIKAVLFDLDGTLLDTLDDLAFSMNVVLESLGFPVHSRQQYRYFVGDGIDMLVKRSLPNFCASDINLVRFCVKSMRKQYALRWRNSTRPYEGVESLIKELNSRGIVKCILSNKPHRFVEKMVEYYFGANEFNLVIGQRDGVPNKPDPSSALEISERVKIKPQHFFCLGDTNTDMKTALNAGMVAVGALWGFRTAEELIANGAKVVITKPEELISILDFFNSCDSIKRFYNFRYC